MEQLTSLVQSVDITPQTYAGGLRAHRGDPPANPQPAPRPAPQPPAYPPPARRRPTSSLRQPPPREWPTSAPRQRLHTIGDGTHTEEMPGKQSILPPRQRRATQQAEETPGERPIPPPRRRRGPRAAAEERPTAPSPDQDDAVERLVSLFLAGAITPQTYMNGLRALTETPLTPDPIPPPRRRRAQRDAQLAEETPGERPIPPPRWQRAPRNTQLAEEMPGKRPIPPPRDATPAEETPGERQLEFRQTRWTIGAYLRRWQMDVPQGHPNGADPRAFLEGVGLQIQAKLEEEIEALNGVKFQLALKAQLRKDNPDGGKEYVSPVMRHKQEAALQNSEIDGALNQALPAIQETLEKWTQRGSGWVVDWVETLWLDIARYQP